MVPDTESEERLLICAEHLSCLILALALVLRRTHRVQRTPEKVAPDSARSRAILINSTSADDQLAFANARRADLEQAGPDAVPCDANVHCLPSF